MCGAVAVVCITIYDRLNRANRPYNPLAGSEVLLVLLCAMVPVILGGLLILIGIVRVNLANRKPRWLDLLIRWFFKLDRPHDRP